MTAATCWPTPLQETLLRAILLHGEPARQAWHQWRAEVDVDDLDSESRALLAPLSSNLQALGVDESLTAIFKGVRRQNWVKNRRLMKVAVTPLRALDAAGMPLLLLNGAALALSAYRDFGLRAITAVDVLVPAERARDAIALLEGSGWTRVFLDQRRFIAENYLQLLTEICLRNSDGTDLVLHWQVMPESGGAGTDDAFWRAAQTVELEGLPLRVLGPADQLLYAMADAIKLGGEARIRWTVDALTILRNADARVDWVRLIETAQRLRLVLLVRDALVYLRERLAAPIPGEVVAELNASPATRTDRIEYYLRTRAHQHGFVNVLRRMWSWHGRLSDSPDTIGLLSTFPRFLQRYYELGSPWRLPAHVASRALRRVRRRGLV